VVRWIVLMITAYQGQQWTWPVSGALAERAAAGTQV